MRILKSNARILFVNIFLLLSFYGNYSVADAATTLSNTTLSQNTTWTKSGSPYIITGVTVPSGITLTVEPGVSIKLRGTLALYSFGTLNIGSESGEQVTVTSYRDDTVGGDTNNDGGATAPTKSDWCSIGVHTSAVANITNTSIRYGGCTSYGQIYNFGGAITISHSKFTESGQYAILSASGTTNITSSEITQNVSGIRYHSGTIVLKDNSIHSNAEYGANNTSLAHTVIDATNNWWGSDKGPFHSTNPSGIGNNAVSNYVTFNPWLGRDPLLEIDLCIENCYSNILFLPGLEASRLYKDGVKLWEPHGDSDAEDLELDTAGKSIHEDIRTKDVLDNAYLPIKGNIYESFLEDLESWKGTEGLISDYAAVPYDWRLSLADIVNGGTKEGDYISYTNSATSSYITEELRRLAGTSKSGKVTIIAHSNGGLVAKALTNKLGSEAEELIDKIVLVAVPQTGTPQAIGGLLHGYKQGLPTELVDFYFSPKAARTLGTNMPGTYHLLPSADYFDGEGSGVSTPVITFREGSLTQPFIDSYGNKIDSSEELYDFLLDNRGKVEANSNDVASPAEVNGTLLSYAEGIHQSLDDNWSASNSISVYQIAGFGEDTLGEIEYWTGKKCTKNLGKWCLEYAPTLQYTPKIVVDGDGTVAAPSALAMSTSSPNVSRWWVELNRYNRKNLDREHADILEVSSLRDFIKNNILKQSSNAYPEFISTTQPLLDTEKRLRYFLHSPLALSAHDSAGNEISATVSTIPGARYERFGEVQYISLPAESKPTLRLDGETEGSFTLEVQEAEGNTITTTTTFEAIPSTEDTEVTMNFSDGTLENASPLVIDYGGDGVTDFSLEPRPGETVTLPPPDTKAPEARVFFDTTINSIAVEGIDESGDATVSSVTTYPENKKNPKKPGGTGLTTVTITDQAGNSTILTYEEQSRVADHKDAVILKSISYNGVATSFSDTAMKYKWRKEKKDNSYKMLASFIKTAVKKVESHYRSKKDVTVIMTKPEDLNEGEEDDSVDERPIKEELPGMIVPVLETKEGGALIKY